MKIQEITTSTIQEWKQNAIQLEKGKQHFKEEEFLVRLRESADLFTEQLVRRSLAELQQGASKGFLRKRFFFENFKEKYGPVKISTLVKGFRIHGKWDPSIFHKIDRKETPFQKAVHLLREKGILLEDISDISKGAGFWLEVRFMEEEEEE